MSPIAAIKDENDNLHTYVCCRGGSRSFRKILIACNGLAAIKFIKSIRLWSFQWFGSGDAIQLIAMCSADDNDNYSRFIDLAGGLKLVVSGKSHLNYGNVDLVVQIAMEHKVDVCNPFSHRSRQCGRDGDMLLKIHCCQKNFNELGSNLSGRAQNP